MKLYFREKEFNTNFVDFPHWKPACFFKYF